MARVAEALGVSARTIEHLKRRFVEQGLEFALERKRRVQPPRKVIFDGAFEARLVALACSPAPPGRTLRLLAEKVVELGWVERVSVMTVQRTLKKTNCSLIGRSIGGSRPGAAPHCSLHGGRFRSLCPSVRPPSSGGLHGRDQQAVDLPVAPGQPERVEHEYVRKADLPGGGATDRPLPCGGGRAAHATGLGPVDRGHVR